MADPEKASRGDMPKDCREVKGGSIQSRIGPGREMNVSLGLYHPCDFDNDRDAAISAAARAAREFKKRMAVRGADIWQVIQALQREKRFGIPIVPGHVLPPKVKRNLAGGGYQVRGRDPEEVFSTVEEAWAVAKEIIGPFGLEGREIRDRQGVRCGARPGAKTTSPLSAFGLSG